MTSSAVIKLGVTFLWMEAGNELCIMKGIRKLGKFASFNLHSLNLSGEALFLISTEAHVCLLFLLLLSGIILQTCQRQVG